MKMVFHATFEHSKELVRSMTLFRVQALQDELTARYKRLMFPTKVLGIGELFENILERTDFFDIFTLMRVNRTFRDKVLGSKPLRRKMLMLP